MKVVAKVHFMNVSLLTSGRQFSCAIDCFIEIWFRSIDRLLRTESSDSHFLSILKLTKDQFVSLEEAGLATSEHLNALRENIWAHVRLNCPSFIPMNCDAQFSEIFQGRLFQDLNSVESKKLFSTYVLKSQCNDCSTEINVNNEVFVNYISLQQLLNNGFSPQDWPNYIYSANITNGTLQCLSCEKVSPVQSIDCHLSDVILVEFNPAMMSASQFREQISINNTNYYLNSMARHLGAHFTCAVKEDQHWMLYDDMKNDCELYDNCEFLLQQNSSGWFFAVYTKQPAAGFCEINFENLKSESYKEQFLHSVAANFANKKNYEEDIALKLSEQRNNRLNHTTSVSEKNNKNNENFNSCKRKKENNNENSSIKKKKTLQHKMSKNKNRMTGYPFPLMQEKMAIEQMHKFHEKLRKEIKQCTICFEAWPETVKGSSDKSTEFICTRCQRDKGSPKKFSIENNMVPSSVPDALMGLTQVEEMLICRAFPVMQVYLRPRFGTTSYKGHVLTLPHNVQNVANVLPHCPKELPIVSFTHTSDGVKYHHFKVRRQKVLDALIWLRQHNPLYHDIEIDNEKVFNLPLDGYLDIENIIVEKETYENEYDQGPCNENEVKKDSESTSYIPSNYSQPQEHARLHEQISETYNLDIGSDPFNEFETASLATLAFPTLFPDEKGDPTNQNTVRQISQTETESFAMKLKHLIKFGEKHNGKWNYRFASHPRFGYWAYNVLYRKRLLSQGNFYMKKNFSGQMLTVEDLRDMLQSNNYATVMDKLMYYAKNVTGTNSYWFQVKEQLKATLNQVGSPTIFWTLSCAEFHWPEFHALFSENSVSTISNEDIKSNVINFPHILDWLFTERVEAFIKHWLYNVLQAEWHWYRFEFSVLRGAIHCHGLAKLKTDPGLCQLSEIAVQGHLAKKNLVSGEFVEKELELQNSVNVGVTAEKEICLYYDYLVSCCNPVDTNEWERPCVHPCKKHFSKALADGLEEDYADLVNSVQRHTKCNSGYCVRLDSSGNQKCRFNYPQELTHETHIKYSEVNSKSGVSIKPEVVGKRNDSRVNRHQQLQLQSWRANCDIQLVIDHHACVEYLAKYASKAEKMSFVARDAFVSVVSKLDGTSCAKSAVRKLMMKSVGERDMGIQEVMHQLLCLKLYRSSFTIITISLENSSKCTINSEELLLSTSNLEVYSQRQAYNKDVSNVNLIDFFSKYQLKSNKLELRKSPVIVRTIPNYSSNPDGLNYDKYCKFQLLKYKPWSVLPANAWDNLPENDVTFVTQWQQFLQSDEGKKIIPNWQRHLNNAELYLQEESTSESLHLDTQNLSQTVEREEWMFLAKLSRTVPQTSQHLSSQCMQQIHKMHSIYTQDQINSIPFWLEQIKTSYVTPIQLPQPVDLDLLNFEQKMAYDIVINHHQCNSSEPLNLIITGQGGSGKSFVINAIRCALREKCIVSSFFGVAAHNIEGVTLHSLLKLPIGASNNCDLKSLALSKLQLRFTGVKYIIIDEFSVIGQKMLGWIDRRCRQATGLMEIPFGGLSVILVGDIAQLPPVSDRPLYYPTPSGSIALMGYCAYQQFTLVVTLLQNQRVASFEQQRFRDLLLRLRDGNCTIDDWHLLSTRNVQNFPNSIISTSGICLAFSNEVVATRNFKMLTNMNQPIFVIKALHNSKKASKLSSEEFSGLEPIVHLCVGAKVMLTRNLWTEQGLCNGAMGKVVCILYKEGHHPPSLPIAVLVKFDDYTGPSFNGEEGLVPIVPFIARSISYQQAERQQLPLKLCWSITIHKSQGLTLENVVIDLGLSEKVAGLAYVAISRVKSLSALLIEPTSHDRLVAMRKSSNFALRCEEQLRLNTLASETLKKYLADSCHD